MAEDMARRLLQVQANVLAHVAVLREILRRIEPEARTAIHNGADAFLESQLGSGKAMPDVHDLLQFALANVETLFDRLDE